MIGYDIFVCKFCTFTVRYFRKEERRAFLEQKSDISRPFKF